MTSNQVPAPPSATNTTGPPSISPNQSVRVFLDPHKVTKNTLRMLHFIVFCDLFFLLTAVSFITVGLFDKDVRLDNGFTKYDRTWLLKFGSVLGGFSSISALSIWLSVTGVRRWLRWLLTPYLTFLSVIMVVLVVHLTMTAFVSGFNSLNLLHFLFLLVVSVIWTKMIRQWSVMSKPAPRRPTLAVVTISRHEDQPCKYKEIDPPPNYEDVMKGAASGQV
jgi:hypothetical protein